MQADKDTLYSGKFRNRILHPQIIGNDVTNHPSINILVIMIYTHTIGRIGKDCQVIIGTHGTFMAVDIAVDDYSKGENITTWVRVRRQWTDRQGESHTQISINADSIAFVNAGKKDEQDTEPKKGAKKGASANKKTPEPPKDAPEPNEKDMPF